MTLEEVKNYFGTGYQLWKRTGMHYNNIYNWQKLGYVPILTQIKLQKLTNGELKANLLDIEVRK